MSLGHGTSIVKSGLVEVIDPISASATSTEVLRNKLSQSVLTAYNYLLGTTRPTTTLLSDCGSTGAGTSYVTISRNSQLETGSITYSAWFNLKDIPINVGSNNNWRTFLSSNNSTGALPLSMILEQTLYINFSTTINGVYRRYLNNSFSPYNATSNGWQNLVFTYDSATGIAACYKNGIIVISGPMTTDTLGSNPTTSGAQLTYTTYQTNGFRIGGTSTSADPNGNGMVPGELGAIHIYNRALYDYEVKQNFESTRGRYGI